jgi:galactokinase/mevalonate kinase-like predicted kinase
MKSIPTELLLSLPPNMCRVLNACDPELHQRCFATYDPPGAQLGSGGGTAYLLEQGWKAKGGSSFDQWLTDSSKLLIHAGGESRRLPAYAASGKLFIPVPALRWKYGQRLDQNLLTVQEPFLRKVIAQTPSPRTLVASGDVLLQGKIGPIPDADVVLLGMWTTPDEAAHFGVLFCDRDAPDQLVTFLQKPDPSRTRALSRDYMFLIDVGVWLLSERAVHCLMGKCGWKTGTESFADGTPATYDLYGKWALALGSQPEEPDPEIGALSVAVVPVSDGEFYHFGRGDDIIESSYRLQNKVMDQTRLGAVPSLGQPRQFVLNSRFKLARGESNDRLWIENSVIPDGWQLSSRHVITGIPDNDWHLSLPEGCCFDAVPLGSGAIALRCYGYTDAFRGELSAETTLWMERPAPQWFKQRQIELADAGLTAEMDLQVAPLFPVIDPKEVEEDFIQWLIDSTPEANAAHRERWLKATRLSARELGQQADLLSLSRQRRELRREALPIMARHGARSLFYKLDISTSAREYAEADLPLVPLDEIEWRGDTLLPVHDRMFRSMVHELRGECDTAQMAKKDAFDLLSKVLVQPLHEVSLHPRCSVMEDQIVWARSPARIDLAGGWSDTPPYCLEHGGSVFNLAVDLNGQPPIQAFVRKTEDSALTIRSIDLGLMEKLETYEEVGRWSGLGSGFAIARAAFALAGFHPHFNGNTFSTLAEQLAEFGGGIEVSLLAAIPKGSGMGTSSILAGTLLGGLADFCSLGWDRVEIARRVSGLEQMLGSGGGWQDQFGGLLPGAKLIETQPGLSQDALVRYASGDFFDTAIREGRMLLLYTGITRMAHNVLGEIVRNMFLNKAEVLECVAAIAENGRAAFDAVQRYDWPAMEAVIDRSWDLNKALDSGTNPPEVEAIIKQFSGDAAALKLAGAGGGGYMLILADSLDAGNRIRHSIQSNPPNSRCRFVDLTLSRTGMQVSRS